ncbi:kinase-like domain-containing protein [Aspergillus keveii]|uniref:Kinase-like domain-containing protein n=1 Tax=Aspergillus keveii TaxID=714993 RepID=A0ABR4G4P8_9EURO
MTEDEPIAYSWIRGAIILLLIGDVLHKRYLIVDKLGSGGYSTVWLARDNHLAKYVALKVCSADTPPRETKIRGPNGTHTCYTVTLAQCNLRKISYSRMFPLDVARALSYGLARAVVHVHAEGYVHGGSVGRIDIYLNNILARLPSKAYDLSVEDLYKEFGNPETVAVTRVDGKPLPPNVPSKAPDTPLSYPADIWSLATAIWDIMGMKVIFTNAYADEEEVVANWVDVLGPFPPDWWARWEGRGRWEPLEEAFDTCLQSPRRRWGGEISKEEQVAFLRMIRQMLVYRPEERLSAKQVMESEWKVKWAYPDYKQSLQDPTS